MPKSYPPIVKRSLFSWVGSSNMKLQILLLFIITITVFARVLPLEMQKRIINEAIKLGNVQQLMVYCGIYLAAVISAGALKYAISVIQTILGQDALAKMRKDLYHYILTLPLGYFRKTQPGMVVSCLVTELAAAGDFVGTAIAVPVTNILTLLAFATYLIWLNPILGGISLAVYPIVLLLIPRLQKQVNRANKKRVDTTRVISSKIGESISGIHEIQANAAFPIESRKFNRVADKLSRIRVKWNLYRQGVKVTNNFFNNLMPFFVFIVGGYLVIKGQLELGAMVAFISAQEKLFDPWKELIDFYQSYQDASVRYRRTMEYFDIAPDHAITAPDRQPYDLEHRVDIEKLSFVTDSGIRLLDGIDLSLNPGKSLALVGFSGSGKSTLALCIAQLYAYTGGRVRIGDHDVAELTKSDMINNVGMVSQTPFIFEGTIAENMLYSCESRIVARGEAVEDNLPSRDDMIAVLHQTGLFVDVLRFGLNTVLSDTDHQQLMERIVHVRKNFQRDFGEELSEYVEFFDEGKYLYFSSVVENLILGSAKNKQFAPDKLIDNAFFLSFLDKAHLTRPLLGLGSELARQIVDILGNLPPDELFFEQSPMESEELDDYKLIVSHLDKKHLHHLSKADRHKLLHLALRFIPGVHKLVALPNMLENLILEGRALLREEISAEHAEKITFYQMSSYIESQPILNNILFGKPTTSNPNALNRINQSIIHLLIDEDFLETIVEIGMEFDVGTKGDRLSGGQRQKLAIGRVLLSKPSILILDEATSALDNRSQMRIQNLLSSRWMGHSTIIAVAHRLDTIKDFDQVAVMKAGKIVEMGSYDELIAKKGVLYELSQS